MSPDTIAVGIFTIVGTLREQLEAGRLAHGETRRLLLSALEKIPPAIEASPEPRESPTDATGGTERGTRADKQEPLEDLGAPGSGTARGSWWRRMFGG
jgi:hypothetical protein